MPATVASSHSPKDRDEVIADWLRVAGSRLLYGLRVLASAALALYVAFWLRLDSPYWAGLTAAIVCQPTIGASLRKGRFRILGTCIGAIAILLLTAVAPQSRIGLLVALAIWCGLTGFAATLLANNASYAAALAGITATVVFADAIGSPDRTFILAVTRATEISLGVVAAGFVLAVADFGDARQRLATQVAAVTGAVARGLADTLERHEGSPASRSVRRDLIGRVAALDPLADEVLGESALLRYRSRTLQSGLEGLVGALSAWRSIATHLEARQGDIARRDTAAILGAIEPLRTLDWRGDPAAARERCGEEARRVLSLPADDPSADDPSADNPSADNPSADNPSGRLLADRTAEALLALRRTANGLALIVSPGREIANPSGARLYIPDVLPAIVNGWRVFLMVAVTSWIWIETAWSGGQALIIFTGVVTILFAPRAEQAYAIVVNFSLGAVASAVLAAGVKFAILPQQQSFIALILAMGLVIVPGAALSAGDWNKFFFTSCVMQFIALLAPANEASYDVSLYLNNALGIVGGVAMGAVSFRLIPPVGGAWRTRRLLALTLRDLRRLAAGRMRRRRGHQRQGWVGLLTARLIVMPPEATPLERAHLVAALSCGESIIGLRRFAHRLAGQAVLEAAFTALAAGEVAEARAGLARFGAMQPRSGDPRVLRARAEAMVISDALAGHADFFALGVAGTGA